MTTNAELDRPSHDATEREADERAAFDDEMWAPAVVADERRYRERLHDDVRPLVDACRRLRERGLLD